MIRRPFLQGSMQLLRIMRTAFSSSAACTHPSNFCRTCINSLRGVACFAAYHFGLLAITPKSTRPQCAQIYTSTSAPAGFSAGESRNVRRRRGAGRWLRSTLARDYRSARPVVFDTECFGYVAVFWCSSEHRSDRSSLPPTLFQIKGPA